MTQKNLFGNVILLIAAITFSACSSSNDDANEEKHNWRLASIQYSSSTGSSYKDAFSYDTAGRVVKWDRYQDGKCYTNSYNYSNDKITIDNGLMEYECTLSDGRITQQATVARDPDTKSYFYDEEGRLSYGTPLFIECEWSGEHLTKMAWGAISEYTYTTIINNIPFIISHSDAMLEWQGYYGKRTRHLPSKEMRYAYFNPAGPSAEPQLECYEYDDYEYVVSNGLVTEVTCTSHLTKDVAGETAGSTYVNTWKLEYEDVK